MEEKQKNVVGGSIQPFNNNLYLESSFSYSERSAFIYKKTEKLVVASNLVAGFIKDNNTLLEAFRMKTLELLSTVSKGLVAKMATSSGDRYQASVRALALVAEITSLCDVGQYTKQVSEMNAQLLKREFGSLHKMLAEEFAGISELQGYLTRDFFAEVESPVFHKGHDKGHHMSFTKTSQQVAEQGVRSTGHSINRVQGSDGRLHGNSMSSDARTDRQSAILAAIKEKGEVGVNDLVGAVKGVGGKTIQRELLAMVAEGVLKKQGERRWSRYSIA